MQPIVFVDDAHTFGGAQIALAWAIRAIVRNTEHSVVCVCTARTKEEILRIVGAEEKVTFAVCPPALPLSIVSFPLRLVPLFKILLPLKRQGTLVWWLNLSGLESCIAPLVALKTLGADHAAWLHCTEALAILFPGRTRFRRALNRIRDRIATSFLFRLHPVLATPSKAASGILQKRTGTDSVIPHLYPTVGRSAESQGEPVSLTAGDKTGRINLWMIGRIQFGQKNNKAAIETLRALKNHGLAACLNIVGDGPDREELLASCSDLISGEEVKFLGWNANPWSAVAVDDLVLIPSFWEGMPLIAIEAMLTGIRIVTTPLPMFYEGVPREFIAKGFSGELLADQVERVTKLSRTDVSKLYAPSVLKFCEHVWVKAFVELSDITTVKEASYVPAA